MPGCPACDVELSDPSLRFCSACGHDLKPKAIEDEFDGLIGKIVDARYKVLGRIGSGGMGVVYRVEHVRMGKVAAMKVLRRDLVDDAQAARRFVREVEVVSKLDHPNIVQTFDFGEWRGLLYLVMELVRGEDLAALVRRDGPLSLSRALPLFSQVCRALDEAHHAGVIHRDLKPDNIVVFSRREGEHVKVLDFGLAKLRERPGMAEVTGAGSLVGTPYYMAPEQVRSEPVDERTDIYALGATIYRVVTGTPAFSGDSPMAILTRHITDPVEPPSVRRPGLPLALDHLVLKAMAKDPANRFATATEMREAIDALLTARIAANEHSQPLPSWVENPVTASAEMPRSTTAVTAVAMPKPDDSDPLTRLRREDLDDFERSLKRRRLFLQLGVPLAVIVCAWAGWRWIIAPPEQAGPTEEEPNDSARTANLAANSTPIFGQLGSEKADGTPDFDYYRIPAGNTPRTLFASVSGVNEINLVLELFDSAGALVGKSDGGGEGAGETLGPLHIGANEAFLRVRPLWHEGQDSNTVTSQTPYAIRTSWGKPSADAELEPNDVRTQASPLLLDTATTGHLSSVQDVDWFVVNGDPGGRITLTLEPSAELPVLVESPNTKQKLVASADAASMPLVFPNDGRIFVSARQSAHKKDADVDRTAPYALIVRKASRE
ncbi:MAG: serine/threonine-protein kinase [Deltaproteobacteria bacterium]|nr:serine/threonine-protein kinase [Deltaproteobacteria bacterium]